MEKIKRILKRCYFKEVVVYLTVWCMLFGLPLPAALANPNPSPGALPYGILPGTSGSVSTNTVGFTKNINSIGGQTLINWANFDIGQGAGVVFHQGGGWVLNNVKAASGDGMATGINGGLNATNCGVIVVNPRGIVFGPSALVNAQSFVASSLRMDVGKFLSGQFEFNAETGTGITSLEPGAQINAQNFAALLGKKVLNMGTVSAGPGGCVIMAAADKVVITKSGSDISVHPTISTNPSNRVVDNGGYNGTGPGTIDAPGADVILAAGDIWSTAIEGVESLRAVAHRNVYLNGAVTATDEVLVNSSRTGTGGSIYIADNIEAGEIKLKAGNPTAPESSMARVQVADGKTLTSNDGHIWIEGVHDITLGGAVDAATDLRINGDKQGSGSHGYGGDVWAKDDLTAGGNIGILGNDLNFDGDVRANGGNLRITGRTSHDGATGWGDIDVASGGTLYASGDVDIIEYSGPGGMTLTGHDSLSIIAGGTISSDAAIGVTGSSLLMQQGPTINTSSFAFFNQGTTDLTLISDTGSVTSTTGVNAANKWKSIGAHADQSITLTRSDGKNEITLGNSGTAGKSLWAVNGYIDIDGFNVENSVDFADWNLEAGTTLSIDVVHGIDLGGDVTTHSGNMELLADTDRRYGHDVVVAGNINSGGTLDIEGTNVDIQSAQSAGDMDIYAHGLYDDEGSPEPLIASGDVRVHGTLSTTDGHIVIEARDDFGSGGATVGPTFVSPGDTSYSASGTIYLDDNVTANGSDHGDDIRLLSNTVVADNVTLDAYDDVYLKSDKTMTGNGDLYIIAGDNIELGQTTETDHVIGGSGGAVTTAGNLDMDAGDTVYAYGKLMTTGTGGTIGNGDMTVDAGDSIYLKATPVSADAAGNMTLTADKDTIGGDVDVEGNLLAGGNIEISASDNTIYLAGDLVKATGDVTLNNKTVMDGPSNQRIEATTGKLTAKNWVHKTTAGNLDMFGGFNGVIADPGWDQFSVSTKEVRVDDGATTATDGKLSITGNAFVWLDGDIYSRGDMTLASNVDADKVGSDAGYMHHDSGTIHSLHGDVDISASGSWIHLYGGNPTDYVTAGENILLRDDTYIVGNRKLYAGDDVVLKSGKFLSYYGATGPLTIEAGDDIILGVDDVDHHWQHPDIGSGGNVTASGDLILDAGDDIYAHGSLTSLGGDIVVSATDYTGSNYNHIELYGPVTAQDNIYITASDISDYGTLIAHDAITANTGEVDIFTNWYMQLYGPVYAHTDLTLTADNLYTSLNDSYITAYDKLTADTGNLEATAEDSITFWNVASAGDNITLNANSDGDLVGELDVHGLVAGGTIDLTASDSTINIHKSADSSALADVDAGVDIILNNDTEADAGVVLAAGDDMILAEGKTLDGLGALTVKATDDIMFGVAPATHEADPTSGTAGDVSADGTLIVNAGGSVYAHGTLTTTGGGDIEVYSSDATTFLYGDYVDAGGSVHLHNTTYAEGDIIAGQDIITDGELTLNGTEGYWYWWWGWHWNPDGPKDQTLDAGENIFAHNTITKSTWGDLELLAGDNVEFDWMKNLTVMIGKLDVTAGDDIIFGGDVWSKYDMTLSANNDSSGSSFYANRTLTSLYGDVDISANGSWINLQDDVTAGDDIRLRDHSRMTNWVEAVFEAGDDVTVDDGKALYAYGNLTVEAGDDITLGGYVSSYGDMLTLDAGDNVVVKGQLNTLAAVVDPYYKNGDVTVYADRNIEFRDNVQVGGRLEAYSGLADESGFWLFGYWIQFSSGAGSIEADGDVIADTMLLSAGAGLPGYSDSHVSIDGLLQTTGGDMVVEAHHDILLGGNVDSAGNLTLNADRHPETGGEDHMFGGDVEVAGTVDAVVNIDMLGNNITLGDDVEAGGNIILTADTSSDFATPLPEGDVVVLGDIQSYGGNVEIYSSDDTTYLGGDVTAFVDVLLNNNTRFIGFGDQHVTAETGTLTANGWLDKSPFSFGCYGPTDGSLYLQADGDISLADYVTAADDCLSGGGVSIISDNGAIFSPGFYVDGKRALEINITGRSDHDEGIGVDLPYGPGKAAIVIQSAEDLVLHEWSDLLALGRYYSDGSVDDRVGVGFLAVPAEIPPGFPRDEGSAFDAAIYVGSTAGDVHAGGEVDIISREWIEEFPDGFQVNGRGYWDCVPRGAMIVDAYDTVTFGTKFEDSLADGRVGDRLEVCSRITEWLDDAIIYNRLPYAGSASAMSMLWYGNPSSYILRGAGLENGSITDGRAWVLTMRNATPPLAKAAAAEAEQQEFAEGGCPALMQWLADELGIEEDIQLYLANTFALSTDIQPCEMCARLKNAADTLADEAQIVALAQVINELAPADVPFSPEMVASIGQTFIDHAGDGTYYTAAGQWIDALAQYVGILTNEMGLPLADSVAQLTGKYMPATDNANVAAFIDARLAALGG